MRPRLRLYLDECVDPRLASLLRARNIEVTTIVDSTLAGATDEAQLRHAATNGLAILTHNRRDFLRLHRQWIEAGESHAGIVIVPAASLLPQLDIRVAMLVDWVAARAAEATWLVTWGGLQYELTQGLRLPGYDDGDLRLALGR